MMKRHYCISLVVSLIIAIAYVLLANAYSFAWCDEIIFTNPPANVIRGGSWFPSNLNNSYPALYSFILVVWFFLFGVSHISAVALEVLFAFLAFFALSNILTRRQIINSPLSYYFLVVLFWLGFYLPTTFTMGRIDMLSLLLMILLINEIIPNNGELKTKRWKVLVLSSLLSLTAIYPLPLIVFLALYLFIVNGKEYRKLYFRIGLLIAIGFILGIVIHLLFLLLNHRILFFYGFLFGYNANLSGNSSFFNNLLRSYRDIPSIVIYIISILLFVVKKDKRFSVSLYIFVILIPTLMTLAGRYERYYWWMLYIPVITLFIIATENLSKKIVLSFLVIITLICGTSQVYLLNYPNRYGFDYFKMDKAKTVNIYRANHQLANEMVEANKDLLDEYENGVFVSELFYYPLYEAGCNCWFIWDNRFPNQLVSHQLIHDNPSTLMKFWDNYIRTIDYRYFPEKGVFFSLDDVSFNSCVDFLERFLYHYEVKDYDAGLKARIISFKK